MSVENISSSEIDYSIKTYSHRSPLEIKIAPITSLAPTLDLTAPVGPTTFQIPSKVISLGNSHIGCDLSFTDPGVNLTHWFQGNMACAIERVVLSSVGSNVILADISNVGNYCEAVCAHSTSLSDFLTKPVYKSGILDATLSNSQLYPVEDIQRSDALESANYISGDFESATNTTDSAISYNAVRHLFSGTSGTAGGGYAVTISVKLPLSTFKFSALAIKKLLYFNGESLNLDVYFAPVGRYTFKATASTSPLTGGAVQTIVPTISNLNFYASVEQNVDLVNSIVNEVRTKGIRMPLPVVWASKNNLGAGAQSINLIYTKGHGSTLCAVFWSPYNNSETGQLQKNHTSQPITQYNTYLNQIPILTNNDIVCAKNEHYFFNKAHLKGSAIQSGISYSNQFTHIDNFTGMPLHEFAEKSTILNGISLAENQTWSLNATTTAQLNNYVFWVCQKELTISSAGIQVA